MNAIFLLLITAACALVANLVITPILIKLSHKNSWYDAVDGRKIHSGKIPRIGGIGIFLSFGIALVVFWLLHTKFAIHFDTISVFKILSLITGLFLITIVGLIDDLLNIRAWKKLLIQIAAALIVTFGGFNFSYVDIPIANYIFSIGFFSNLITTFWIISICNAINLIDGMDALAGGVSFIAAIFYSIIFFTTKNFAAAAFSVAFLGAILGFLVFNFPPAKIFMGDSGSLFLGFTLAVIPLFPAKEEISSQVFFMPLIVLVVPAIDMIAAIIRRLKKNISIATPDREHIHHKFIDFGLSRKRILFVIYIFSITAGFLGLLFVHIHNISKDLGFFLLIFTWFLYTLFFLILHYKNITRKKNLIANKENPTAEEVR